MHDYSLDQPARRYAYGFLAIISLSLPTWLISYWNMIGVGHVVSFPLSFGATFGFACFLFDHYLWKYFEFVHHIPNLDGDWIARGVSSFENPESGQPTSFEMNVKIKQSFSKIEVFTETKESTSRSFMASIETNHTVPIFRYGFDNTPKNLANPELQRHPGVMELRINDKDNLDGGYFSGKHRLRCGEVTLTRKK